MDALRDPGRCPPLRGPRGSGVRNRNPLVGHPPPQRSHLDGAGRGLERSRPAQLVGLTRLWVLGLVAHSFVLTGALPGLTRRRALTLSLTGSAVANVTPVGGALGVAVNWAMVRAWQVRRSTFAAYTVVTNIWDVVAKLTCPCWPSSPSWARRTGEPGAAGRCGRCGGCAGGGHRSRGSSPRQRARGRLAGRGLSAVAHRAMRRRFPDRVGSQRRHPRDPQHSSGGDHGRWPQLTAGMSAYLVLQARSCGPACTSPGQRFPWYAVVAGFAVERLLTLVVLTPGGTGTADWGVVATLVALGGDPVTVAVGALLYRGFTFLLEIPVGGMWLGGWLLTRRSTAGAPREDPARHGHLRADIGGIEVLVESLSAPPGDGRARRHGAHCHASSRDRSRTQRRG